MSLSLIAATVLAIPVLNHRDAQAITPTFGTPNVLVDDSPAMVLQPKIAVDNADKIHVVWVDLVAGNRDIHYANSTNGGLTWTPSVRVDDSPGANASWEPDIAVNRSGGEVYVVYRDSRAGSPGIYIAASQDGGQSWAPSVRVDDAPSTTTVLRPSIAVDFTGAVYVAWEDWRPSAALYQIRAAVSTTEGASWSASQQISSGVSPFFSSNAAMAASTAGFAWIVWRHSSGGGADAIRVGRTGNSGATWTAADVAVGGPSDAFASPDVSASSGGRVDVVFTDQVGSTEDVRFTTSSDGGVSWSALQRVDDATAAATAAPEVPTVTRVGGDPFVVWSDQRNGNWDMFASGSDDNGASWGDCPTPCTSMNDARVDDTGAGTAFQQWSASASSAFGLYVVWQDSRIWANQDIYFASYVVSSLVVTEVRDSPDGATEMVELANLGGKSTDVTGYTLVVDGTVHSLTPLGTLPPNVYRTVGPSGSTADLQIPGFTVGVAGNQAGSVELRNVAALLVDSVRYGLQGTGADPLNGVSTARFFDGAGYSDCWTLDLTHTFGAVNDGPDCALQPELLLNEILYDASAPSDRFLELYYTGSGVLDPTGYRIQGNTLYTLPPSSPLTAANPLLVVRNDDGPAATLFFTNLVVGGDNLYLYRPGATGPRLDQVGWSSTHPADTSVCRVPDGYGASYGYDDGTTTAAGWVFGCAPNPALVAIGPDQSASGYFGDVVRFNLTVTNKQPQADTLDLTYTSVPNGWGVQLRDAGGVSPLVDTDTDGIPDTGAIAGNGQVDIVVLVTIPTFSQSSATEWVNVTARASLNLFASDVANLVIKFYPYLRTLKSLSPNTVNVFGTGWGEIATLSLEVIARGQPFPRPKPLDIVLMLDSSGSMASNDPTSQRLVASEAFINELGTRALGDRVSALDFDTDCAWTRANVGGAEHHLNSPGHDGIPDYSDPIVDVWTIDANGWTNLLCPLQGANAEFTSLGDAGHVWAGILLTDGADTVGNADATILAEADTAAANGISIFTVALNNGGGVNIPLLQGIAGATGGQFYATADPNNLRDIFLQIAATLSNLTASSPWQNYSIPMIEEVLPPYITAIPGSFSLTPGNDVEVNPTPDYWAGGSLQWNVSAMYLNDTWGVSFQITCSQVGTQAVELVPASRAAYVDFLFQLQTVPFPSMDITCLPTGVPPVEPPREVTTTWDGATGVGLTWTPPAILPDHYLIYRVTGDPRNFADLSLAAVYTRVSAPATSWTDVPLPPALAEYYYLMRSANAAESDLSRTSNTAGIFVGQLRAGLTAISRPLEYFPWVDYSGAPLNTLDEHRLAYGAQWVEYMDPAGNWLRVPGTGIGSTALQVGRAYVVSRTTAARFVFTGLPGTHLLFDEYPAAGFVPATTARSLTASVTGSSVDLLWLAVPGVAFYEVLYATTRTGFFDGTAVTLITTTGLAYTHSNAVNLANELYYLVKPLGGASSTYSIGVWTATFAGHGTFGLPLRPAVLTPSVSFYATAIPNALGVVWLTTAGVWVPHFAGMPAGVYDRAVSPGVGYQLTVNVTGRYSFIGW
ncbi:MAG TPA: VWA domain-containing protein [Thermoplasmata archaeon]|nr:VWA domain-containing protein [Thermoplasmata archaeon]